MALESWREIEMKRKSRKKDEAKKKEENSRLQRK
jgi:hypothetical protein